MIEIRNCSKAFGEIHAIDHVSMEIGERQIFGLVGTNGAGKSTLLRMAAGVIKPDEGEILVDQEPVYENEKDKTADILHFQTVDIFHRDIRQQI